MSQHNQKIGQWGEEIAAEYFAQHGYTIINRNIHTPYGKIDIIAEKDGFTCFVEVKTRTTHTFGAPEIGVTPRKQAHMLSAAEHYAQEHEIDHWQIDVIALRGKPGLKPGITHFENALG